MELWATQDVYSGSGTLNGTRMAAVLLSPLNAGATLNNFRSGLLPVTRPPGGLWRLYLLLTEFTGDPLNDGYVLVDSLLTDKVYDLQSGTGQLANLSVRTVGGSGANTLIMGFVVGGTGSKDILVRSVGPSLSAFGVSGVMSDPQLRVFDGRGERLSNDNWAGNPSLRATFARLGAFALPDTSRDAAIQSTFTPGAYTAQTSGPSSGVALMELYDAGGSATFLSGAVRAVAGSGNNSLIVGFTIVGEARTVLIRATGPALAAFGVSGAMADPTLKLFRGSDELYVNDDWSSASNLYSAAEIQAASDSVGAFRLPIGSLDAVIMVTLQPGSYTAVVSGVGGSTGVALLEVSTVKP